MVKGPAVCSFVFAWCQRESRLLGGGEGYSGFSNTPVLCVVFITRKKENFPDGSGLFIVCSCVHDRNQSRGEYLQTRKTWTSK